MCSSVVVSVFFREEFHFVWSCHFSVHAALRICQRLLSAEVVRWHLLWECRIFFVCCCDCYATFIAVPIWAIVIGLGSNVNFFDVNHQNITSAIPFWWPDMFLAMKCPFKYKIQTHQKCSVFLKNAFWRPPKIFIFFCICFQSPSTFFCNVKVKLFTSHFILPYSTPTHPTPLHPFLVLSPPLPSDPVHLLPPPFSAPPRSAHHSISPHTPPLHSTTFQSTLCIFFPVRTRVIVEHSPGNLSSRDRVARSFALLVIAVVVAVCPLRSWPPYLLLPSWLTNPFLTEKFVKVLKGCSNIFHSGPNQASPAIPMHGKMFAFVG